MNEQNENAPVVVTDSDHPNLDPEQDVLSSAGLGLRREQCLTAEDVIARCRGAKALINQYAPITAEVLDALPELRLVVRYGVGVETVDIDAATRRGVWVANVPDYGTAEVADHTMALALALLRGVTSYDRSVRSGGWDYQVARPLRRLSALTFGVIGCGTIGLAVAARAAAFGMRVVGADVIPGRNLAGSPITQVDLDELLAVSDIISVHATMARDAAPLIGAQAMEAMRPSAMLVNTARGGLIDTAALVAALDMGQLGGAALDVLETEPATPSVRDALARHPRVVLSPHAAWYSEESYVQLKSEVAREAVRVLAGQPPRCPVNQPKLDRRAEATSTEVHR
ncbi:C-terminal binding protein [Mycolicibacterium sp. YH-1]|uniref:C-terminal binding protein n=1 Tax=Mycolicibacterium sp. YH-1 TaxID=2908837 RepID=UPI001F4BCF85|nr:C-terminal binding protein [Mycolicibacterium sp. YH-1]UNB54448.1 C-terminal binding protein [Mycolicibacterium sp. YH-1]